MSNCVIGLVKPLFVCSSAMVCRKAATFATDGSRIVTVTSGGVCERDVDMESTGMPLRISRERSRAMRSRVAPESWDSVFGQTGVQKMTASARKATVRPPLASMINRFESSVHSSRTMFSAESGNLTHAEAAREAAILEAARASESAWLCTPYASVTSST